MKRLILMLVIAIAGSMAIQSCGENRRTDLVESGTYTGVAEEVDASEQEIYVRTSDNKLLELYFTDETVLTRSDGTIATFDELTEGGSVEVQVEKRGDRLEPLAVKIL